MDYRKQIDSLKLMIEELEKELKTQEGKADWTPATDENYFFVSCSSGIWEGQWGSEIAHAFRSEKRNIYKTREEAQLALTMFNYATIRSFTPDWDDETQRKYFIVLDNKEKTAWWSYLTNENGFAPFYYATKELALEVIERFSFDELAAYYGRV